ncbi:MAG TPA: ABC transporter permease [Stellaceae bacterium]|nr:ABC transporter permease [Stellaceae bacterium]
MTSPAVDIDSAPATPVRPVAASARGYWRRVGRRLSRDPVTIVCAAILALIFLSAIFAGHLAPADPYKTSMLDRLKPFGFRGHLLGTDELGRDVLSRLLYGGRLSLLLGVSPVVAALAVGGFLGTVAGFFGGAINTMIMRTVDVFYAFPSVLLAIAISGSLGAGITNAILSLTIVFIPPIARVSESVTAGVRNLDYVGAARASGAGLFSVLRVHVLRNVLGPVFVYATSLISVSIILASGLSFLGLGVEPPHAEWGLMLNTLRPAIYIDPTVAAVPGAAILLTSISFNLLTDGLRHAMDVRA